MDTPCDVASDVVPADVRQTPKSCWARLIDLLNWTPFSEIEQHPEPVFQPGQGSRLEEVLHLYQDY